MPRPQNKTDLLVAANEGFNKLFLMINTIAEYIQEKDFLYQVTEKDKEAHWKRDKNIRDVLIHLYEWHQLTINWINANRNTDKNIPYLPSPYTWKSYGDMNIGFWEKHQSTSLKEAKQMLTESHNKQIELIESFKNEELFTKAYYKWSGTTNIGSYFVSNTSSHYDWAMKKIKRQIKEIQK